ncbi:MAG: LysE family translocator [Desulfomonile tiedjei]|nr:LysE family translocator [Desulfomonile tiedjei]
MDIYLSAGIVLGLSAGFSPGPLTTLVISQALQYGAKEGIKVAVAPFITDLPIVLLSLFALTRLHDSKAILGLISILGGLVVAYLAYSNFRTTKIDIDVKATEARSLGKGTLVNFFNPHPYLFWLTVGAPKVVEAWQINPWSAAGFLGFFYACLIGSKMLLAYVAARSRQSLSGKAYRYVTCILGALLLVFAALLLRDGISSLMY